MPSDLYWNAGFMGSAPEANDRTVSTTVQRQKSVFIRLRLLKPVAGRRDLHRLVGDRSVPVASCSCESQLDKNPWLRLPSHQFPVRTLAACGPRGPRTM